MAEGFSVLDVNPHDLDPPIPVRGTAGEGNTKGDGTGKTRVILVNEWGEQITEAPTDGEVVFLLAQILTQLEEINFTLQYQR